MSPINPRHARAVDILQESLIIALIGRARMRGQSPVHLDDKSDPRPDVAVVRLDADDYLGRHPGPADIFVLIEVADSTLRHDKSVKVPRYALTGVPDVWLVDLEKRITTIYRQPSGGRYLSETPVGASGFLCPLAFPDLAMPAGQIVRQASPHIPSARR